MPEDQAGLQGAAARRRFVSATVIDAVGSGLWMPFALLFFQRAQGIRLVDAGAALSIGGLVGLCFIPLIGRYIDRIGLIPLLVGCNVIRFIGFAYYNLCHLLCRSRSADRDPDGRRCRGAACVRCDCLFR